MGTEGTRCLKTCSKCPIPHLAITGAAWLGARVHPAQLQGPGQIPGISQNLISIAIIFSSFLSGSLHGRLSCASRAARSARSANPQISTKLEERGRREEGNPKELALGNSSVCQISSVQEECPGHHERLSKAARGSCPHPAPWVPQVSPGRSKSPGSRTPNLSCCKKSLLSCTALPSGWRRHSWCML